MSIAINIINPKLLSSKVRGEIDKWLAKFPLDRRQSAVIAALKIVQEENNGYLTQDLMDAVADYLQVAKSSVYEVATFYNIFDLKPVGRYKLYICTNVSCMLCGSEEIVSHIKSKLGIDFGQTTKDGKFTLYEVECLGACDGAPVMQLGYEIQENLTIEKIDALLESLE